MADHNEFGKLGEEIALEYLIKKGYQVLAQNYRYLKSEIDIIAQDKNEIVFVEVKTRQSNYLVEPEHSVTMKKQRMIIQGAHRYLTVNQREEWSRFDVISIVIHPQGREIRHIEGAFTAQ